jgi:hypothetical protein
MKILKETFRRHKDGNIKLHVSHILVKYTLGVGAGIKP